MLKLEKGSSSVDFSKLTTYTFAPNEGNNTMSFYGVLPSTSGSQSQIIRVNYTLNETSNTISQSVKKSVFSQLDA